MPQPMRLSAVVLSVAALASTPALSQTAPGASSANPTVPVPPQTSPSTPPERLAPPATNGPSGGTLTDRLSKQQGTVSPPNVDPGITVSPPANQHGAMPVIPPPGTPGGNAAVVPK